MKLLYQHYHQQLNMVSVLIFTQNPTFIFNTAIPAKHAIKNTVMAFVQSVLEFATVDMISLIVELMFFTVIAKQSKNQV